jgi:hypothetical protein
VCVVTARSVLSVTRRGSHFAGRPVREVAGMPRVWSLAVNGPTAVKATRERERERERKRECEKEREYGITRAPWPISSHANVGAGHELQSASTWKIGSRKTGYVRLLHERRSGVQCPRHLNCRHATARARHTARACLPIPVNDGLTAEPGDATGNP